jgi:hypothetical protein
LGEAHRSHSDTAPPVSRHRLQDGSRLDRDEYCFAAAATPWGAADRGRRGEANRHFPPPWSVEDIGACFVVKDSSGQSSAISITRKKAGRRSTADMLSKYEARRIAANVAKLPELLRKSTDMECNEATTLLVPRLRASVAK